MTDHSTLVLENPKLAADSVIGQIPSQPAADPMMSRQAADTTIRLVALPLTGIATASVRRVNWFKTTGAILGGFLLVSMIGCAATQCLDY